MALIFITGAPGTGKSAMEQKLHELGYSAHDADTIGAAYNTATNEIVKIPPSDQRTPGWFATHQWRVQREKVEQLKAQATDKPIFLCGTASNEDQYWDLFDQILILDVDEKTLKHRILTRTDNDYGRNAHELDEILKRHSKIKEKHLLPRVTVIDATKPLNDVISQILGAIAHPASPESH